MNPFNHTPPERLQLVRLVQYLFILLSLIFFLSCKEEPGDEVLNEPVIDDTISAVFPRMGFTAEKAETFRNEKVNTPQWNDLIARMSNMASGGGDEYGFGAYHFAVAYSVTGDEKFKNVALEMISRIISEPGYCDVTSSYLRAPDCTGQVALAADILFNELTDGEKNTIFDYLETNAQNIVELRGWSGWGWQEGNPHFRQLNNYYPGHLQTILHYAILAYNHRELARDYFDLVVNDELPTALQLMSTELKGGHGAEGTWYDDKLYGHYAEVVLMIREATAGQIDFGKEYAHVFADYVRFRLYAFNPLIEENGKPQLYHLATGDQPAVRDGKVIDLSRLRLWLLMDLLKNTTESEVAGYIRHFEENVNFETKGWQREFNLYYLLHYDNDVQPVDYTSTLPQHHFAEGKGLAHYRTGWDADDMTVTIHFSPSQGQRNSHWHFGEGAFYIWYKGWQADHLNRVEGDGIRQHTALMNTLLVNNNENSQGAGDAMVTGYSAGNNYMVATGDATGTYSEQLQKFQRTLIVTGKVITVYDLVVKKNAGDVINFNVNAANGFTEQDTFRWRTVNHEGSLVVTDITARADVSSSPMSVRFNYTSDDNTLHLLHGLQVGNEHDLQDIQQLDVTADGNFLGVIYHSDENVSVHLVNQGNSTTSVEYSVDTQQSVNHIITGLEPGNYNILRDGQPLTQGEADAFGVMYFDSQSGGTFEINKV